MTDTSPRAEDFVPGRPIVFRNGIVITVDTAGVILGGAGAMPSTLAGIGLHFNLLSGAPLTEVSSLVDARTRTFFTLGELTRRAITGAIAAADVRRECDAQLAALAKEGLRPAHLDSHRHPHALPGILAPVLASARAAGVRIVRRPFDRFTLDPVATAKRLVLRGAWQVASRAGCRESRDAPAFSALPRHRPAGRARCRATITLADR